MSGFFVHFTSSDRLTLGAPFGFGGAASVDVRVDVRRRNDAPADPSKTGADAIFTALGVLPKLAAVLLMEGSRIERQEPQGVIT